MDEQLEELHKLLDELEAILGMDTARLDGLGPIDLQGYGAMFGGRYSEVPRSILTIGNTFDELVGNLYSFSCVPVANKVSESGTEYVALEWIMAIDESAYLSGDHIAVTGDGSLEGWNDLFASIRDGRSPGVVVYFRYGGFSETLGMQYGYFEHFVPIRS